MQYDATLKDLLFPQSNPPMFTESKSYDRVMIAAEAARLSYFRFEEDEPSRQTIQSALAIVGFGSVEYFSGVKEKGQAVAALPTTGEEALLAFRGTRPTELTDIVLDLELFPSPWTEGGKAHHGFSKQFQELRPALAAWHERVGRCPLLITGHSLGAGLATLCATVLKPSTLVTIGSSRVGDADFVSLLASTEVHRFVNCCDLITRLPTMLGYTHVGNARYIDRNGVELSKPTDDEIAQDQDRARSNYLVEHALQLGNVPVRDGADHAPINYVSAILGEREN
jgi:hypothetical protein